MLVEVAEYSVLAVVATVVISTLLHGSFDLDVSAIVGSAVFNLLVIPALSGIYAGGVEADRMLVYKEAQFYSGQLSNGNIGSFGGGR